MQAVNIRQLKNNPSQVLRTAHEDDMVVVMNRDTPTALLIDLEKLGLPDMLSVKLALAVALFKNAAISAGSAARMAGKTLPEMLTLLSNLGIPLTTTNAEEAAQDMSVAREWLQQHT
jgi:prevent-host-death family protein